MTKGKIALLGSAMLGAVLLGGAGIANAQDYYDRDYDANTETVIVHPYYDDVEQRRLPDHTMEYRMSRPVSFSDLDLTSDEDYLELRDRIHDTAQDLCYQLDAQVPGLRGDRSADRECVRNATRNAIRAVLDHRYG
jgi:UrcA family protein